VRWAEKVLRSGSALGQMHLADPADVAAEELISVIYGAVLIARATNNPSHFANVSNAITKRLTSKPLLAAA
jgi:hypothetical protein